MKAHRVSIFLLLVVVYCFTYSSNGTPVTVAQHDQAHSSHTFVNPA